MQERVRKLEMDLHDACTDFNEALDPATTTARKLVEVKEVLALPVHVAN